MQVAVLSRRVEERRQLRKAWRDLTSALSSGSEVMKPAATSELSLGAKDGRLLAGLIRGESRSEIAAALQWRRDTLDRHLGNLRERLGHENTGQLLLALASLRPGQAHGPQ